MVTSLLSDFLESADQDLIVPARRLHEKVLGQVCSFYEANDNSIGLSPFLDALVGITCETTEILSNQLITSDITNFLEEGVIYALQIQQASITNGTFAGWATPFNISGTPRITRGDSLEWSVNGLEITRTAHWQFNNRGLPPRVPNNPTSMLYNFFVNGQQHSFAPRLFGARWYALVPQNAPNAEPVDLTELVPRAENPLPGISGTIIFGNQEIPFELTQDPDCPVLNLNGDLGGVPVNVRLDELTLGEQKACPIVPGLPGEQAPGSEEGEEGDTQFEDVIETTEEATEGEGIDNEDGEIREVRILIEQTPSRGKTLLQSNEADSTFFAGYFRWLRAEEVDRYSFPEEPIRKLRNIFLKPEGANGFRFYAVNEAVLQSQVIRTRPIES